MELRTSAGKSSRLLGQLRKKHRFLFSALLLLPMLFLGSCTSTGTIPETLLSSSSPQWVVGWGASPENALTSSTNTGGSEQSFRSFFIPTIDGTEERIHLSNLFGTTPITVGAATLSVAIGSGPSVDPTRNAPLTFGGASSIVIPAGTEVVSDPVNLTYSFGENMAVSVYLRGAFPALTQHNSEVTINYATPAGAGNTTSDASGSSFSVSNLEWYLLTGMDVYGQYQGTVAIFGSSSVDGHESNYGSTNSYPTANVPIDSLNNDRPSDYLARQLVSAGYRLGVLNAGEIDDPAAEDPTTQAGTAIAGVDRMKHDVLAQAGIKTVIIYFGGIDLRSDCVPATNVEASLANMVSQAQAVGVRVILATLPPAEYCTTSTANLLPSAANPYQGDVNPGPENSGSTQRRLLNTWILSLGAQLPGVVATADFDQALRYTAHPDFYQPQFFSSDNFHPNAMGYGVQSSAIPIQSILPSN